MVQSIISLTQDDGYVQSLRLWLPGSDSSGNTMPKGFIHICHGMAEHSGRYQEFAQWMCEKQWGVIAQDHRGHGLNLEKPEEIQGYFGPKDGWARIVDDSLTLTNFLNTQYPQVPKILLGHSMGSFLARTMASRLGNSKQKSYQAYIFSGTAGNPGFMGKVGAKLAQWEARRKGPTHPSTMMNTLMFGSYSKAFKPKRTEFDWVSSSPSEVDGYVADPWCGFLCTSQFYADLLQAVLYVNSEQCFTTQEQSIPVLLCSGAQDPVGDFGKGVRWVEEQFKTTGIEHVTTILYPDGRHEMFHEAQKTQVFNDLWNWIGSIKIT